jgi:serine/threonine-protein kinase
VSALRASAVLSNIAGAIAATEYLVITFVAAGPLSAQQRSMAVTTAALLAISGACAAAIATYIIGQASAALRAVREQDLMGKYLMHERLGAGGMAEVYRATYSPEGGFEKVVAIKRVLPAVAETADARVFLDMFREEARLGARLSHPNVLQVLDAGRFHGIYVVAMEYVDGVPLSRVLGQSQPLAPCAITYVAAELAAALDYIHTRTDDGGASLDLVHRDVNPPNVLVSRLGDVKLADFGVAHAIGRASLHPDRVYGKPGYMAPEQIQADALDGRTDLFALGLTLYEMIAGKPLFPTTSLAVIEDFRIPEAELAATPLGARLPDELRRLVVELLALDRDARPASGAIVRNGLLALTGEFAPFPNGRAELARAVRTSIEGVEIERAATAATMRAPQS